MAAFFVLSVIALVYSAFGQQIGPTAESHPRLRTHRCTMQGCIAQETSVVLDYQWRNIQDVHTGESCVTADGNLNQTICPTSEECAARCALDGANYLTTGVETSVNSVTLYMYRHFQGNLINVEPQIYLLLDRDYAIFKLLGQEVSFDVDVSKLPCGLDGAAYLTGMDPSGGRSKLNPAGAMYGTGYCDSQCNHNNFINGIANVDFRRGACCNEMDLWEANARSNQLTTHPCNLTGLYVCSGDECELGNHGPCARTGCDFNPYGLGGHHFYGYGALVDTKKQFKVITQFITHDGTKHGSLTEIRRLYVQSGKLVHNLAVKVNGATYNSITAEYCEVTAPKSYLEHQHGGLTQMGDALRRGMVLVMGIWTDPIDYNRWLDSGSTGPCGRNEGSPESIKMNYPNTSITFSNIRWGDIDSTYETQVYSAMGTRKTNSQNSIVILFWLFIAHVFLII